MELPQRRLAENAEALADGADKSGLKQGQKKRPRYFLGKQGIYFFICAVAHMPLVPRQGARLSGPHQIGKQHAQTP
nr:hypothetical protein [uncultured Cupriavidus sp.]